MQAQKIQSGLILTLLLFLSCTLSAQDVKDSKDHPLFNRMPGYRITGYNEHDFNVYDDFYIEKGKNISVEGHTYNINYGLNKGVKPASGPQVLRNYKNAVKKAGGSVVYEEGSNLYLKLVKDNRVTWVRVNASGDAYSYFVWIIEEAEMEQDIIVDANSMMGDINEQGRVALYGIYFDFNKTEVNPESDPTLKEIAKLLSDNPSLNLFVVGHTDNTGDFKYNMELSQGRAEAVVKALVLKYNVDSKRLKSAGVGPLAPFTTNDTEEGKTKNRRVELIKK